MKTVGRFMLTLLLLGVSVSISANSVAEHYGWTDQGGGWYSSSAFGPVLLETPSVAGAWGWSEAFGAKMFFSLYQPNAVLSDSSWRYIYHDPWATWLTTTEQGNPSLFPRLYLFAQTEEVDSAIEAGALLLGATEEDYWEELDGYGWVLATVSFPSVASQLWAYASILSTSVRANATANQVFASKLQSAANPSDAAAISQMLAELKQAIAQSASGVTQALAQSISQGQADQHDLGLTAHDYATAYRVVIDDILGLAEQNGVGQAPALSHALVGMSQALAQGYLGTTQALSQGHYGLQAAQESDLSPANKNALEKAFRSVTDAYTFAYVTELLGFAGSTAAFEHQPIVANSFLAFTQSAAQGHLGMTQSMAQAYVGVTQAIFASVGEKVFFEQP